MRLAIMLTVAAMGVAAPDPARAQADPCAGALDPARIVECLKLGGIAPTTRGIRPSATPAARPAAPSAAQPQAAAPPPAASIDLSVPFAFDSAELTPAGRAALDALAAALKDPALSGARFRLAGHTDAQGSDAYNMALSQRRAASALRYLTDQGGIAAARLAAIGFGRSQLYDTADPLAASNRRVQVIRLDN